MEIPYQIVGSVASTCHGIGRAAEDVDIIADLQRDQLDDFSASLEPDFYADVAVMREALIRQRSFNLIHFGTAFKFDIFPLKRDQYSRTQFARRRPTEILLAENEPVECSVASAEDTILSKLLLYRSGGETSEIQWSDLRGIVRVQGSALDRKYLDEWAAKLGVADLLERLLAEQV